MVEKQFEQLKTSLVTYICLTIFSNLHNVCELKQICISKRKPINHSEKGDNCLFVSITPKLTLTEPYKFTLNVFLNKFTTVTLNQYKTYFNGFIFMFLDMSI